VIIPRPTPAVIAILKTIPEVTSIAGGRVSTVLSSTLPAVRVTLLYDLNPDPDWRSPVYQVEAWATDDIVADQLANAIFNAWRAGFRGAYGGALVLRTWPHSGGPHPLQDPDSALPRAVFDAALFLGEQ
jgi:hypothetical protein